jgi:AAA domain
VASVSDDLTRIVQFWQAVEIFSPQKLPERDPKKHTIDVRPGESMPWALGSSRSNSAPEPGYVWRYEVFGGVYPLSRVRDALVAVYGQDAPESAPVKGDSALFACTVDENGFLVEGSTVVSACAWGVGRANQGKSVLTGFQDDIQRYADGLGRLADAKAGFRLLAKAIRDAVPDAAASGVGAAVTGTLAPLGGPLAAAAGAAAGSMTKTIVTSSTGQADQKTGDHTNDAETNQESPGARLDVAALTGADLQQFSVGLAARLGVSGVLRPLGVRVHSYQIKADRDDEAAQPFLNSFLADDLELVAAALRTGDVGDALASYLTGTDRINAARTDMRKHPRWVLDRCKPGLFPPGRWVTGTDRPLAFSQQFAVNQIVHALSPGQPGLFAVNGPPGTGKTTMLRDLIAAIIVQRATELASLDSPGEGFTGKLHEWPVEKFTHKIAQLTPGLTGHEIVVASSNNAAVENVTAEIPGSKGIDQQWHQAAANVDYFRSTAARVTGDGAWALIAAVLGNSENRKAFVNQFWYGAKPREPRSGTGMLDVLACPAEVPDWHNAVASFRVSLAKVTSLSLERDEVSCHIADLPRSETERDKAEATLRETTTGRQELENRRPAVSAEFGQAVDRWQAAGTAVQTHMLGRPGGLSGLSASGRQARREWKYAHAKLQERFVHADSGRLAAQEALSALDKHIAGKIDAEITDCSEYEYWDRQVEESGTAIAEARRRWGKRVPDGAEYGETEQRDLIERRETSAPWADEEFSRARTELFLAALALHKAFILAEAKKIRANLNALTDILHGKGRPGPAATLAAWQTLFLIVPVVSSTFASFGRLFAGLRRESLGWLLVDEAGQATPQSAAGALWRSQRTVIVGDPLQLKPVVALPWGGQQALLREFAISDEWAPSRTSVQQVADRLAVVGTELPGPAGAPVWVGTPLRVHRRCDRPMFEVSNRIAYKGLMVFGTPQRDAFHGSNVWYDVRSGISEDHWIPEEGQALRQMLKGLRDHGVPVAEIRVLSPFRAVAAEAVKVHEEVFETVQGEDREKLVGTVHIMQGREADVVVMILGGDPRKPDARRFATEAPNLLNVAVSRARRRFYVIGNRETWGAEPYFAELRDPALLRHYRPGK